MMGEKTMFKVVFDAQGTEIEGAGGTLAEACDAAGYLCGPRLRDKKLKDIARGKRRKMRKMRREREARRAPKAEV